LQNVGQRKNDEQEIFTSRVPDNTALISKNVFDVNEANVNANLGIT